MSLVVFLFVSSDLFAFIGFGAPQLNKINVQLCCGRCRQQLFKAAAVSSGLLLHCIVKAKPFRAGAGYNFHCLQRRAIGE